MKEKTASSLDDMTTGCAPGLYRIFLSNNTQEAFHIAAEDEVTQEDNTRTISKQQILDDISKRNNLSEFFILKKQIEEYPEEDILIIYDYEFQYDKNYYLCLSLDLKFFIENVKKEELKKKNLNKN
jgi:hypothetical protein